MSLITTLLYCGDDIDDDKANNCINNIANKVVTVTKYQQNQLSQHVTYSLTPVDREMLWLSGC